MKKFPAKHPRTLYEFKSIFRHTLEAHLWNIKFPLIKHECKSYFHIKREKEKEDKNKIMLLSIIKHPSVTL